MKRQVARWNIMLMIMIGMWTVNHYSSQLIWAGSVSEPKMEAHRIISSGGRLDWSATNGSIVFDRMERDGYFDVWVMNSDGTEQKCLTCSKFNLPNKNMGNPAWHPSGKFIIFQAEKNYGHFGGLANVLTTPGAGFRNDLWLMDSAGKHFWQLTNVGPQGGVLHAHFSPDGHQVIWAELINTKPLPSGQWVIKAANIRFEKGQPSLTNIQEYTPGDMRFYETHGFALDSAIIIFSATKDGYYKNLDIYTFNLQTQELMALTDPNLQAWDEHAHFSPDGKKIVWMSSMGIPQTIRQTKVKTDYWIMNADGSDKKRITYFNDSNHVQYMHEDITAADNAWSPDGKSFAGLLLSPLSRQGFSPIYQINLKEDEVYSENFSNLDLDFFDATAIHPDARAFQLAFYEKNKQRAIFIPWGPGNQPLGVLLAYHTDRDFKEPTSYQAVDLTKLVHPDAQGFGGAFMDEKNHWLYFPAFRKQREDGLVVANTLMVRFDLRKELDNPTAYELFDAAQLGLAHTGWVHGGYVNDSAYFMPTLEELGNRRMQHGIFLRYDASKQFNDPAAWSAFDLERYVHPQAKGFQSADVKAPFVYLIPYGVGASHMVRYDTRKPFADHSAYEVFDLTTIHPEAKGFTGSIVVDEQLVLTPWRDLSKRITPRQQSRYIAVAFDTRRQLSDKNAWSFIDLTEVHPDAKGYTGGWVDKAGFVYFVPTANFAIGSPPPFVVWDSRKPFTQASSWMSWPSTGVVPSTGAAYDLQDRAWLAPYGVKTGSGLVTQVTIKRKLSPPEDSPSYGHDY